MQVAVKENANGLFQRLLELAANHERWTYIVAAVLAGLIAIGLKFGPADMQRTLEVLYFKK